MVGQFFYLSLLVMLAVKSLTATNVCIFLIIEQVIQLIHCLLVLHVKQLLIVLHAMNVLKAQFILINEALRGSTSICLDMEVSSVSYIRNS